MCLRPSCSRSDNSPSTDQNTIITTYPMGGDDSKPEVVPPPQENPIDNSPKQSPRRSNPKPNVPQSNISQPNKASDSKPNSNKPSARDKHASKDPSLRNSPDLKPAIDKAIRSPSKLSSKNISSQHLPGEDDEGNEFMPLMNWPAQGSISLGISLVQLIVESGPKPCLTKNNSVYKANLIWEKLSANLFSFKLKEEPSYQVSLEVDLEGGVMTGSESLWMAICPANLAFGRTVKMGNFKVVNVYQKLGEDADGQDELGPSLKNIELPIRQQAFGLWGEPIPKSYQNRQEAKKQKRKGQAFQEYKEWSRYFDEKNTWLMSTYVEQTSNYFRGWLLKAQGLEGKEITKLSNEVKQDLLNRETFYIQAMYGLLRK